MGFRFRRSIRILPGIRMNFGKGFSTSVGVRGAHVTLGRGGPRVTVGLPGTGLSYTHLDRRRRAHPAPVPSDAAAEPGRTDTRRVLLWTALIIVALFSASLQHLATS